MHIGNAFVAAALELVYSLLNLYIWLLIVSALMSWLVAFDVINPHNRLVRFIGDMTYRLTEPALKPIRRFVPVIGGLDLSPLVLIFLIFFLQSFIRHLVMAG